MPTASTAIPVSEHLAERLAALPPPLDAIWQALEQVIASTGYGRVAIEIKDGQVRLIEVSTTALIKDQE